MQTVGGKTVLTTLEEILDPRRAAVLVVDMQNDLCAPGGLFDKLGFDLSPVRRIIPFIQRLLAGARAARVPVVHIQMTVLPDYASWAPAYIRFHMKHLNLPPGTLECLPGTWGWQVIDELRPEPGDLTVSKWRSGGFTGTNLDLLLRGRGAESVVICGEATYACVESTVRDAMHLDYYTIVAPECVQGFDQDLHDAALRIMRSRIDVVSLEEILNRWRVAPRGSQEFAARMPGAGSRPVEER
ncbi:MAG: cysteine hydrolase [Armatimonadetes bacterium]|nr:cysteine hydrolase [Armatimonadota bacterium]